MPRPDTGNFNRFLTSLGLLLLAVSLIIPYFYFRSTDTLSVPVSELSHLTKTGRSAIEGRQKTIATLEVWVAVGSVGLGLGGVAFLFLGGLRLRRAQESEEEEGELRKERTQAEIRQMSPERVEGRRDEQARGVIPEEVTDVQAPKPAEPPGKGPREKPGPFQPRPQRSADERYRERRDAIARVEEKVVGVMSAANLKTHEFLGNVTVGSTEARTSVELDGLLEARNQQQQKDIVLDITLFDSRSFKSVAHLYVQELVAKAARYQALSKRLAMGWLVAVVPDGSSQELDASSMEKRLAELIDPLGFAFVVKEEEIPLLPERLATAIS